MQDKLFDIQIGGRLKAERQRININQEQIANAIGATQAAVSKIENGNQKLNAEMLSILKTTFDIDINWLLTGEPSQVHTKLTTPKDCHKTIEELHQWLTEICVQEPKRAGWFEVEIEDKFPLFKEWLKKRDETNAEIGNQRAA